MIHDFPYTNLHALNLDWILQEVKKAEGLSDDIEEAIETAGAAEEAAINAAQAAQQATALVEEAMTQIGSKASVDYVDEAVRTSSDFLSESINAVAAVVDGKVTKRVGGGTEAIMYGQAKDGTEKRYTIGVSVVTPNTVPMRDANGNLFAADPTANQQVATKGYVDNAISGTGNVPTPTTADKDKALIAGSNGNFSWSVKPVVQVATDNIVYGRIGGQEDVLPIATGAATANTIARRGANGVLFVGNPTNNGHAATKKYVDDSIATVQPWPIALITLTGPDTWSSTTDWSEITAAVTYGIIKFNAGGNEWYTPIYAINQTTSITIKTYGGQSYNTYTINQNGTYTAVQD